MFCSRSSSWRNLDTTSLGNLVQQLLTFAWDHFSYNVEVIHFFSNETKKKLPSFVNMFADSSTLFNEYLFKYIENDDES